MQLKYKILGNTFIQFLGRLGTAFFGFLTTLLLANRLGASGYGSYTKIFTLVSFFFLFVDFGLNAVYIRKYQQQLKNLSMINAARTIFFLVALAVIVLFLFLSQNYVFSLKEKYYVLFLSPIVLLYAYQTSLNIIFQLKLRYDLATIASVVGSGISLLGIYLFLDLGLVYIFSSLLVGYMITVLLAAFFAKKLTPYTFFGEPFLLSEFYLFLKSSLPLGTMLFLNSLYVRADVFVVSAFHGNSAVGIYQLAYKFFEFPLSLATFFANSIFPYYVTLFNENSQQFKKTFNQANWFLVLTALFFVFAGFIGAPLLSLVKAEYQESVTPLRILVLAYPIFFLTSSLSWLVFLRHQEKNLIWVYGLGLVFNIVANLLLVPEYSYLASSWITIFSEVLILVLLTVIVNKQKVIN